MSGFEHCCSKNWFSSFNICWDGGWEMQTILDISNSCRQVGGISQETVIRRSLKNRWYHGEVSQLAGGFATFHGSFQTNHATESSESWHLQLLKFEQVPFEMVLMIICQDAQVIRICMHSCKHVFVSVCVAGLHGNNISATNHPSFRDQKWSHVQASTSTTQALPAPTSGELWRTWPLIRGLFWSINVDVISGITSSKTKQSFQTPKVHGAAVFPIFG